MKGWSFVPLGEACRIIGGGTPTRSNPSFYGGPIPWVTPKDMKSFDITDAQVTITQSGLENSAARLISPNSILVVVRSGVLKHTIPIAVNRVPVAINQDMKALTPGTGIDARYCARFLKARSPVILRWVRATTADNFPLDKLREFEIPLPPLHEQRRIAEILDKADALRAKRRAALAQLDALSESIFLDMFGDPATNPKGWNEQKKLGDIAQIVSGVTKGRPVNGKPTRAVPYLAVANVQDRSLRLGHVKVIEATEDEIARYRLRAGDLLLTEGGDPDKLGRGTLWSDELPECIHQNHIFRVRLISTDAVPVFLNWLIGSERGKRYFLKSAKQTTGIASINMTQLRGFPLLLPPARLQHQFAHEVKEVETLEEKAVASTAELDALFASLQHRAFRGEL